MTEPELGRKPLAIQRILSENVGNSRPRSYGRLASLEVNDLSHVVRQRRRRSND